MSCPTSSPFVQRLLANSPEFKSVFDDHVSYQGELLPHVFMGDLTRHVLKACNDCNNLPWLKRLLSFFEAELEMRDAEANDLICASFCENLVGEDRAIQVLQPLMGLSLRHAMKESEG